MQWERITGPMERAAVQRVSGGDESTNDYRVQVSTMRQLLLPGLRCIYPRDTAQLPPLRDLVELNKLPLSLLFAAVVLANVALQVWHGAEFCAALHA